MEPESVYIKIFGAEWLLRNGNQEMKQRQASLALELAVGRCRPITSKFDGLVDPVWAGLCNYLVITALDLLDPINAYNDYSHFADRELSETSDAYSPVMRNPIGFFSNIRQPKVYSWRDSALFYQLYTIPARLELLKRQLGDSLFWARMREVLQPSETGYRSVEEVQAELAGSTEDTRWFSDTLFDLAEMDWRLDNVTARSNDSGVLASGVIVSRPKLQIPMTIAYVFSSTDTVFQVIPADSLNPDGPTHFSIELRKSPRVVILDPRYDYPDANRFNNYYFFEYGSGFHEDMSQVFPGYRRLRLAP